MRLYVAAWRRNRVVLGAGRQATGLQAQGCASGKRDYTQAVNKQKQHMPNLLKTWLQGACKLSLPPLAPRAPIACFAALIALAFSPLALAQPADDDAWHFSVGIGAASQPKFPGSSETRLDAIPTFSASKGRLHLGALPGAGASLGVGYTVWRSRASPMTAPP